MATEQQVMEALRTVMDPDLGRDIVSLGFVKGLAIQGGHITFTLELTSPACPMRQRFRDQCEAAVGALDGVELVTVNLTARQEARDQETPDSLAKVGSIIAVSSCKGGVGKSTVAAHLARTLQREGLHVGLLDADLYGPSFPTLFNIHKPDVFVLNNLIVPLDVFGMKVMSMGFLLGDAPAVMRGPMVSNYIKQILTQTDWGTLDYLLIDMPPGTGDAQLTITQSVALQGAVIVTTPHTLSLVDVAKGILMFERVRVPVLGIVENMSYFECDQCGKRHHLFGTSAGTLKDRFGLPTLAELPIIEGISDVTTEDAGKDLAPIQELAKNLRRAVCEQRLDQPKRPQVSFDTEEIRIEWPDGAVTRVANFKARISCRCASCIDEHTGELVLDIAEVPPDVHPESVQHLGNYAVSIAWSDGHTGIYPWEYLKYLAGE